jgi:hypothetical protein
MATTGAKRQAASMARLRTRAEASGKMGVEIAAFREACGQHVAEIAAQGDGEAFDMEGLLVALLDGDEAVRGLRDLHGRLLAVAMGLPADPWPHLTGHALGVMIGDRGQEALSLGFPAGLGGGEQVDFLTKLRASRHLDWLLQDERAEAA